MVDNPLDAENEGDVEAYLKEGLAMGHEDEETEVLYYYTTCTRSNAQCTTSIWTTL